MAIIRDHRTGNGLTTNGTTGNDTILTYDGNDIVYAGNGNDLVYAGNGNDIVYGGAGDDTIKRLFAAIDEPAGAAWVAQASAPIWGALPERFILDWDSTVQTKYGHQEGAEGGEADAEAELATSNRQSRFRKALRPSRQVDDLGRQRNRLVGWQSSR